MGLREDLSGAMKEAMKAGDKVRLSTVRLVQAALKDRDIDARGLGREPLSDTDILGLIQKMIKQTQESHDIADTAGRADLADQAKAEIAVLSSFLPRQMDEAEMQAAIAAAVAESGASGAKDMGKVIGLLKERFAGRMDFGKVSPLVKQALAG